jgi:glycosyltransferase involved in cell wall biosynthesis
MTHQYGHRRLSRPRLLILAYGYDRAESMESRLSWQRAQYAAQEFDVTVVCERGDDVLRGGGDDDGEVTTVEMPANRLERALMAWTPTYYVGYRLWQRRVYATAKRLHGERRFDLVQHVSFCGYREPGDCWRLGAPFVWGPIGGTQAFPLRFLGTLDARGALRELTRNVINACQLRFSPRVRRAMKSSVEVIAANRAVAQDVERCLGREPLVQLETGIGAVRSTSRTPRDPSKPLKILWSGRLQAWKGLPLLLRALADVPTDCPFRLRVLGQGTSQNRWQKLARRLGIGQHIEWAGWPDYARQLPHYDWADVFAFTSLRDTSGTGLLEALAAGAPIIGVDHQGAADIMSEDCAIGIPVTNPAATIAGFRDAVVRLSRSTDDLATLSEGALRRARQFTWEMQWDALQAIYSRATRASAAVESAEPSCDTLNLPSPGGVAAMMLASRPLRTQSTELVRATREP